MKKIMVSMIALSMVLLTACSSSTTDATATASATASADATTALETKITVANDSSTFSYIKDVNTDTGYNISNALMTPNNLIVADDNYLYYVKADTNGKTHLYRSDKEGKNETVLIDDCGGNLNIINGNIIYSGQDLYDVYKYNISTKKSTRIFIGLFESVYVVKDTVYMSNSIKGIVSCNLDGSNYKIISRTNSYIAGYDGGYLYYSYSDSATGVISLNRVKLGETTSEQVLNDSTMTPALVKDGLVLCITTDQTTSSYVFQLYSLAEKKITDTVLSFNPNNYGLNSFSMSSGSIYFSFSETVAADPTATATTATTATATAIEAATVEVDNLYSYDISSKKTYNLGKMSNVLIMFAGGDMYTIDGNMDSSYVYTSIDTLTKLNVNANAINEQSLFAAATAE